MFFKMSKAQEMKTIVFNSLTKKGWTFLTSQRCQAQAALRGLLPGSGRATSLCGSTVRTKILSGSQRKVFFKKQRE